MRKRRVVGSVCAAAATLLLAFAAAGVARADPRTDACDVQGLWAGLFFGTSGTAPVIFDIFNQAPPAPEDDDGSPDFALADELATGLGNAFEGDKYHFRWSTFFSLAEAQGHGFLFVAPGGTSAMFVVAGHGDHPNPALGSFTLTGEGDVLCGAGQGMTATAMVHVRYSNDTSEDGEAALEKCLEECEEPEP
jgi:hypothetical protein